MRNSNYKFRTEEYEKTPHCPGSPPVLIEPLQVKVYDNLDRALRAFRALVQKERILSLYKEKQFYEKPSDKKRRKRNERKRKLLELQYADKNKKKDDEE
jgi:small subunit ribosomal protein S21